MIILKKCLPTQYRIFLGWGGVLFIDHKKLPFMAMLRNLRNLIKAGISDKHHNMVIRRLTNEVCISEGYRMYMYVLLMNSSSFNAPNVVSLK